MSDIRQKISIDETPLREWILRAYHGMRERLKEKEAAAKRATADHPALESDKLVDAVRDLLSGPAGGPSAPSSYFFEVEPDTALWLFVQSLDAAAPGLSRAVYDPLLAVTAKEQSGSLKMAPNLSLYVASLAGPIALKCDLNETVVCALIAAALLTLARLGRHPVTKVLGTEEA